MIGLLLLSLRVAFFVLVYGMLLWLLLLVRKDLRLRGRAPRGNTPSSKDRPARSAHLVVSSSADYNGPRTIAINRELLVGRDDSCGLRLADSSVSTLHARVYVIGDEYFVEDMGSTNGTVLRSEKVTAPARLRSGDILTLGRTILVFKERP